MKDKEVKVLIFVINDEYYAADIMEVERILKYSEPTALPESPNFVEGVIKYENKILPIISLSKKFNIPQKQINDNTKIIVIKQDTSKVGIIVDLVSEVKDVLIDSIEKQPDTVSGISKRYLKGLIKMDDKIVIFINLSNILTKEEKDELE